MTLRPRATEIPILVRRLGSRRQAEVDSARARLSIVGARAVEALIESLEEDNNRIRVHAMPLLALIQDPRGREPLVTMLLDRDPKVREVAARSLARFPHRDSVARLTRQLAKEKHREVRVAVVHALLEQCTAGQDEGIPTLHQLLLDPGEDPRVRVAALPLLPLLPPADRRGVLKRLKLDASPEMSQRAAELEDGREATSTRDPAKLRTLLRQLASDDYAVWNEALHRVASLGTMAVRPLIEEMQHRAHDPEYCTRAGMALKAMGARRARALAETLDRVNEPLPLQVLVEVMGTLGEKSLIYRLKDLIDRIARGTDGFPQNDGFDPMHRVRAKAHLELARIGSRVAIEDLRATLSNPDNRVEVEILAALQLIGTRDEIPDLLRAYLREDRFMKERITTVVQAIMKRERIRRNSSTFQVLGAEQRRVLDAIVRSPRPARGRRGPPDLRLLP
jgi:HEAT repeat protein